MHILIIPSWYPQHNGDPGGSFFRDQAIALAKRVEKIGVLFPNLRSLKELWNPQSECSGNTFVKDEGTHLAQLNGYNFTPRSSSGYELQWLFYGVELFQEYVKRNGKPDLIHAHCALYAGLLAKKLSSASGIPYVVTEHSSEYFSKTLSVSQLKKVSDVYAKSAKRLAVSHSLARLLVNEYHFINDWTVIPNMVNNDFYAVTKSTNEVVKFLNVALLNQNKRQELLIDALALCHTLGNFNFQLTIAGDGPLRKSLEKRVASLSLQNFVQFLGVLPRDQIPILMSKHDVFLLSSNFETFGVVVAEALSSGLYCISTDCGGPSDIIHQQDGVIVPVGDHKAMANAMIASSKSDDTKNILTRRLRSASRFSEEVVCKTLIESYEAVLV